MNERAREEYTSEPDGNISMYIAPAVIWDPSLWDERDAASTYECRAPQTVTDMNATADEHLMSK